jgi:hypothetical protein
MPLLRLSILLAIALVVLWMTGCMERLFYHPTRGSTPPPTEWPDAEGVHFNSADGTTLFGWFIPARSAAIGGNAATIIHVHGNAGNIESHIWFTEYLPDAGFNLFVFDYRGYGQSEGSARDRGDLIADTEAALDAMLARGDVDPNRIGVYGQSLGGSIALNVMADRSEIGAAVIESAFTGWRAIAADALGGGPVARGLAAICIPAGHRAIEAIARIDRPILILHGTQDSVIPVHHGRELARAAPNAELIELAGGDHNTLRSTHPRMERRVIEFFRDHLGESPPADKTMKDPGGAADESEQP